MHTCTRTHTHAHWHTQTHTHTHAHMCTHTHINTDTYIGMYTCTHMHTHTFTHTQAHTHTHTHPPTHTHTHTLTKADCRQSRWCWKQLQAGERTTSTLWSVLDSASHLHTNMLQTDTAHCMPSSPQCLIVPCSTNVGEGLVKHTTCNDVPGRVEWTCGGAVQKSRNKLKGCYQL